MVEGWQKEFLGNLVSIASGQVDPKESDIADQISIGPDNLLSGGGFRRSSFKTARELGQISGKYEFDAKSILYSKIRPNLNKVALPDFPGICSADMYPMWINDETQAERLFVYYVLISDEFVTDATARSFRTGMPKINRSEFEGIEINLPSILEQRKIAEILKTWDEAVEALGALRATKKKRLEGLTSYIVNGQEYERQRLHNFIREVSERNSDGGIDRILSVTNSAGFVLAKNQFAHRVASADTSNYKIVRGGQYAYNPSRINVGSIARLDDWDNGILSPMYAVFAVRQELDSDFFGHWLASSEAKQRIRLAAQGSVRETVGFDDLGAIMIPCPHREKQTEIAQLLNMAHKEVRLTEQKIEALTRQKRGLMQKLLTGEWRVAT